MNSNRKVYGYYLPIRRDQELAKALETNNKMLGRVGVGIAVLGLGGYYLYRKLNELSKEVKKIKEETGK